MLKSYRKDIDGLRAIAVLLVLVFHFDLLGIGEAGFIGVDIFFVISGYLISSLIWKDLESRSFRLSEFYLKRVRRLAPALLAVQFGVLACAALFLLPGEVTGVVRESLAAQAYVSNIYYWKTLNYFGLHANSAFLLHTWSLAIEEQFYLLFPLFLLAIHRWARGKLALALLAIFAVSFALNIALVHSKPEATFYLLPTRAWELVSGALLAFVQPHFERSPAARLAAALAGLVILATAIAIFRPGIPFPGFYALMPVTAAALLLMAGSGDGNVVSDGLSHPAFTFFGRISYPLYLVHWPLNIFGLTLLPDFTPGWRWTFFFLSVLLAFLITSAIEEPVRRRRFLRSDRQMLRWYGASLLLVAVAAASAWETGGWRFRFSPEILRVADVSENKDPEGSRWDFRVGARAEQWLRPIGADGKPRGWLIYGDSHAAALARSFSMVLSRRGESGEVAFHSNCMPVLDSGSRSCRAFNRLVLAHARDKTVLLVSVWREPLEKGYAGRDGRIMEGDAAVADASAALARTVAALRAQGARVLVWEPLPTARYPVPDATARSLLFGNHWPTARPLAGFRADMHYVAEALARAGVPEADRIDPAPVICPDGQCTFVRAGLPIYSDTNHPALHAAPWFADRIAPLLPASERSTGSHH